MYKPTEPAQWIWYPGDFEFYLGLRVQSERWERLAQITTEWKMETFYQMCGSAARNLWLPNR